MTTVPPTKVSESAGVSGIREQAVAINRIIDYMKSMQLRESPNVRIERSSLGTTVHVKPGGAGSIDDTWY